MNNEIPDHFIEDNQDNSKAIGIEYFQSGVEKFLEGMHDQARQDFLLSLEFDPTLVLSYCYLSSIYNDEGDADTSIELCQKGLSEEHDNPHLHFCLGMAFDLKGMKQEALKEYLIYYQDFPKDAECAFSLANVYDDLSDQENAKIFYEKAVDLDPEHHKAFFNWALLLASEGNEAESVRLLKKAVDAEPNYWKAWVKLGIFCSKIGNIEEAISAYSQAVSLCPGLVDVHYNLGISYKLTGKFDEAVVCFREVIQLNPEDVHGWHNYGVANFQAGNIEEALEGLRTAISLDINHAEAHYRLACLYITLGENDKARTEMEFLKEISHELYGAVEELLCESLEE